MSRGDRHRVCLGHPTDATQMEHRLTEPEQTLRERGWHKGECYELVRGPVHLTIRDTSAYAEDAWRWEAVYGNLKRSEGYTDHLDDAMRRAERAAVLQWLLVALETGNHPEGFPEAQAWLSELKKCLDFDRYAWGVWHVGEGRHDRQK